MRSALRECVNLRVGWEAAGRMFGEFERAVSRDVKHAAAGADEFNLDITKLEQSCPRTEGFGLVASTAAVSNDNLHARYSWIDDNNGLMGHSPEAAELLVRILAVTWMSR